LFYVKMNNINNVKFNNVVFNDVNVGNMNVVNNDEVVAVNLTNSPNPFTTNTVISFNLPESGNYTVAIYDVLGNLVNVIADGEFNAGTQSFVWDATDSSNNTVNTGTYIYRLTGNNLQYSGRMIVNK
jgi:flagellar hook assembly protein FlgD